MQIAKRLPPSIPAHPAAETETAVWVMIAILLGLFFFAIFNLVNRVLG